MASQAARSYDQLVPFWNRTAEEKAAGRATREAKKTAEREKARAATDDHVRGILAKGHRTDFDERFLAVFVKMRGEEELERLRREAAGLAPGTPMLELLHVLRRTADDVALSRASYGHAAELAEIAAGSRQFNQHLREMQEASDVLSKAHIRLLIQLNEVETRALADDTDGADEASGAVRAELGNGNYSVDITRLPPNEEVVDAESFVRAVAVARAGMALSKIDEFVLGVRHVDAQELVADVPLSAAVELTELLERVGVEVKVREGKRSTDHSRREPIPERVRHEVWRRDSGACVDCGSRERLEFDHIVPVTNGGSNTARNIELRCESCNRRKGARI